MCRATRTTAPKVMRNGREEKARDVMEAFAPGMEHASAPQVAAFHMIDASWDS